MFAAWATVTVFCALEAMITEEPAWDPREGGPVTPLKPCNLCQRVLANSLFPLRSTSAGHMSFQDTCDFLILLQPDDKITQCGSLAPKNVLCQTKPILGCCSETH